MKLIFFDFEVFKYLWLVVFIDNETRERKVIINNPEELRQFYNENKENIFCGYNSRMYDQFILKGILNGLDPYEVSNQIIQEDKSGYQVLKGKEDIPFNNFDISTGFHGLKQLEGFMGSKIKESSVPFDIDRKLTETEINEVVDYCIHDVEQTIKVFENRKEEYDSQLALIQAFELPMSMFNKTKAQLSALVLGTVRNDSRNDEFNLTLPDTLNISEKYQYIVDWYKNPNNMSYKKSLNTNVSNVPHIFAWGGLHGAIQNYSGEGIILCCDVASLYPAIMIEYGFLSRNVTNPSKYTEIRDTRLKLKAEKNPMQQPYKIVLNSTYGAMKDKHNPLYDPLMANNVCVAGQLLLLDLIEKIEPYGELIQSNTDGIFIMVKDMETVEVIKNVAKEWEQRTRLELEWEIFSKIYQKDVNNYIIVNSEGKYKSKGAYVKKLSKIDYDLPIVNRALVNYFIKNKPIEETINECDSLIEYQKIVKVSSLYKYALYGEEKLPEKVLRVFASKDENACSVYKVKSEDRVEKIANTPEKCFVYNDDVTEVKAPEYLDKEYYIELANKRLNDYISSSKKYSSNPSDIKFVNMEIKEEILQLSKVKFNSFVDLAVHITENTSINSKQFKTCITLNYFKQYGLNNKLLQIYEEFIKGKHKYSKNHKEKTKLERLQYLYELEKSIEDIAIPIKEQIRQEIEFVGNPVSTYNLPKHVMVLSLETNYTPKVTVYGLHTGKTEVVKINKKIFKKTPLKVEDIILITDFTVKPRSMFNGHDENGKPKYTPSPTEKDIWLNSYEIKEF